MRTLLVLTLVGASLPVLGCGGGSGKRIDSSAGGQGGSAGIGSGGAGRDGSVGGSGDAGVVRNNCPQAAAAPCGGNLVGTWTVKVDECVFPSSSYCPGMTFSVAPASSYNITYTFNANGTLSTAIGGTFIGTVRYPPECLYSDAGAAQACTNLSSSMQSIAAQLGDAGTDNITTASYSCSADSSETCVCDEKVTYASRTVAGTYVTSGTTITITSLSGPGIADAGPLDGGATSPSGYCVSGNTLTLWSSSSSGSTNPTVATK